MRTAQEGTLIATMIMLSFALCGAWILAYLNISEAAFKIAGDIILFLVALDILAAKRQARKRAETTSENTAKGAGESTAEGAGESTGKMRQTSQTAIIWPSIR